MGLTSCSREFLAAPVARTIFAEDNVISAILLARRCDYAYVGAPPVKGRFQVYAILWNRGDWMDMAIRIYDNGQELAAVDGIPAFSAVLKATNGQILGTRYSKPVPEGNTSSVFMALRNPGWLINGQLELGQ